VVFCKWANIEYFPQVREDGERSYSLLFTHIKQVFENKGPNPSAVDLLSGNYLSTKHGMFNYSLSSSASWINNNLILRHIHTLSPKTAQIPLRAADILALPLQLCPHHSTTTKEPPKARHTHHRAQNSPMLTYAISKAFPAAMRDDVPGSNHFRNPTPLEQQQINACDRGESVIWRCRGCTTKFRVEMVGGRLVVTTYHCLGADLLHAVSDVRTMMNMKTESLC
jgi:hypothetical protein